jgi:hypothetical protein
MTLPAHVDLWWLLSVVNQHPNVIRSFRLAQLAVGADTTGIVNDVRGLMAEHIRTKRVRAVYEPSEVTYLPAVCRADIVSHNTRLLDARDRARFIGMYGGYVESLPSMIFNPDGWMDYIG